MNKIFTFARETSVGRTLIPMGIIFIVFGIIMMNFTRNADNFIRTDAVVTKAELVPEVHSGEDAEPAEQYDVYIKYTVKGKEYETYLGEMTGYKVGDKVKISYNPEDPEQIIQAGSNVITSLIFVAAGLLALAGGIISLIKAAQKRRSMKKQEEAWTYGR